MQFTDVITTTEDFKPSIFNWANMMLWGECFFVILGCVFLAILSVFFMLKTIELYRMLKADGFGFKKKLLLPKKKDEE